MKKILIAMMLAMPLAITAQDNTWEQVQVNNPDQKYLVGAVPEIDGHVVFTKTINAPGKSAKQIYELLRKDLLTMTKEPNQIEQSRLTLEDADENRVVASFQEWLVFKNKPLNLDRTRFLYQIIADCKDGQADIKLNRIVYIYDEERDRAVGRRTHQSLRLGDAVRIRVKDTSLEQKLLDYELVEDLPAAPAEATEENPEEEMERAMARRERRPRKASGKKR